MAIHGPRRWGSQKRDIITFTVIISIHRGIGGNFGPKNSAVRFQVIHTERYVFCVHSHVSVCINHRPQCIRENSCTLIFTSLVKEIESDLLSLSGCSEDQESKGRSGEVGYHANDHVL